MDEDLDCVEHRSSSIQEEEISGIAEDKHFKEQQETQIDEGFLKLELSGELKNYSGDGNPSKENQSTAARVQDGLEGLDASSCSVVVVDENQEPGDVSKIVEKCLLASVDEAEDIGLMKGMDSECFWVTSINEAGQDHCVKPDDFESCKESVVKSFRTDSRHRSVEADERMVQNGDGGKMKRREEGLKIELIDDTAVIDSTSVPGNGNGYRGEKKKQGTDERRDKRIRRRSKCGKQGLDANGKGKMVGKIVEAQKNESGRKWVYSRKEMEVLRYVNSEEQRKMWMHIRCCLGPVVLKEYDGLEICTNQKHIRVNFDPRQQFSKKEGVPTVLSMFTSDYFHLHN